MFGQKREKVRWDWRKLRNDESFIIFTPHSILRVIKSIKIIWEGYVHEREEGAVHTGF